MLFMEKQKTYHKEPSLRILLQAGGGWLHSPSAVQLDVTGPSGANPVLHEYVATDPNSAPSSSTMPSRGASNESHS